MSSADSKSTITPRTQGEPGEYRAISSLAVAGFLLGIASALALGPQVLWSVPLIGAITNLTALLRIDRSAGTLAGRTAALWGLALSVFFGAVAPAHFISNEQLMARRAEEVGRQWFNALADGEPQVAKQLELAPRARARLSDPDQLWKYYREVSGKRRDLEQYVAEPLIHTLLALGKRATVRLYQTQGVSIADEQAVIFQTYAVTYDDQGARKTFFVNLSLERNLQRGINNPDWRVLKYTGGVTPD